MPTVIILRCKMVGTLRFAHPIVPETVIASGAKQCISPRKGRMDCFVASLLAMTVFQLQTQLRDFATHCARAVDQSPPERGRRECRVRAAPAVSCAKVHKRNAHEHTGSAEAPRHPLRNGFTAYACSPRRRIRLVTVIGGLTILPSPVGPAKISTDLTPATGARTTRFCRTQQPVFAKRLAGLWRRRLARCCPLTRELALRTHARRRCRVHRIPSRVRDDRDTPLLPGKDGASWEPYPFARTCPAGMMPA